LKCVPLATLSTCPVFEWIVICTMNLQNQVVASETGGTYSCFYSLVRWCALFSFFSPVFFFPKESFAWPMLPNAPSLGYLLHLTFVTYGLTCVSKTLHCTKLCKNPNNKT
jgi:hypothetical protein